MERLENCDVCDVYLKKLCDRFGTRKEEEKQTIDDESLQFKNVITSAAVEVCGINMRKNGSLNDWWDTKVRKILEKTKEA